MITLDDLTPSERNALETIAGHTVIRRKGGYGVRGQSRTITLALIHKLERKRLITCVIKRHQDTAEPTLAGQIMADKIKARRKERQGA